MSIESLEQPNLARPRVLRGATLRPDQDMSRAGGPLGREAQRYSAVLRVGDSKAGFRVPRPKVQ